MSRLPEIDLKRLGEPVGLGRRVVDVLCIAAGAVMVFVAVSRGGPALPLLVPGVGFLGVGVFLLSRRRRLAEPATMVRWFQEALDEQYPAAARGPGERAARLALFQQAAAKLAELGAGEPAWAVIGGAGGSVERVAFVELISQPGEKHLCLLVPEPPGPPGFFLGVPALEEQRRAEAAFERCEKPMPGTWRLDCNSYEDAAAEVERAFAEVFELPPDFGLKCALRSTQPAWVLGISGPR